MAALEPIVIPVLKGLESAGDTISRTGRIETEDFQLGGHRFVLDGGGLDYDVAITNTGEGMLVTGIVRGSSVVPCDRCLADAHVDIASEVSCYYLSTEPESNEEDEEEYGLISSEGTIDISEAIQSALAMDLPYVVLCSDDCKGLCPVCGCNLNEQSCDCVRPESVTDAVKQNPFAALAGFVFEDGRTIADIARDGDLETSGDSADDELEDDESEQDDGPAYGVETGDFEDDWEDDDWER